MAIPSAEVTRFDVGDESIDQPTLRRLKTSRTTAQETLPSQVRCSVTHSWSGSDRTKLRSTRSALGTVVLGTAAGDLHDIGKTILGTMLNAHGFEIIDLGVNVSADDFVEAVRQNQPEVLGMSSLLTITAKELAVVIGKLSAAGLRDEVKVIVGGGAVTDEYAESIGADGYGHDAELGVRLVKGFLDIGV
jgi:methylmalonyl-CoA mutase cobalamin-binding domain/chain